MPRWTKPKCIADGFGPRQTRVLLTSLRALGIERSIDSDGSTYRATLVFAEAEMVSSTLSKCTANPRQALSVIREWLDFAKEEAALAIEYTDTQK